MLHALLFLIAIVPVNDGITRDFCERFEDNNYFDCEARLVFTQLIARETNDDVFFWRMNKEGDMTPRRERGRWVLRWDDQGVQREVWARSYDVTFTQYDPEVEQRNWLPVTERRTLSGGRK